MIKVKENKKNKKNEKMDKNFFKQMNYEIAAEHGIIENEEMKENKGLNKKNKKKKSKK